MAGKIQHIKPLQGELCNYWPGEDRRAHHLALTGINATPDAVLMNGFKAHTLLRGARLEGVRKGFLAASFGVIAPVCPSCHACVPLRVNTEKFTLSDSQRKLLSDGRFQYSFQKTVLLNPAELFRVFKDYISTRHNEDNNPMFWWSPKQFNNWLQFMPFTLTARDHDGRLAGFSTYEAENELAIMEYAAYDPAYLKFSMGKRLWLEAVVQAQASGIQHVYVGSWAKDSPKLGYKSSHRGLETLIIDPISKRGKWVDFDPDVHTQGPDYVTLLRREGFEIRREFIVA